MSLSSESDVHAFGDSVQEPLISEWILNAPANDPRGAYLELRAPLRQIKKRYDAAFERHKEYEEGSLGWQRWQVTEAFIERVRHYHCLEVGTEAFELALHTLGQATDSHPDELQVNPIHLADEQSVIVYLGACKTTWEILGYTFGDASARTNGFSPLITPR